MSSAPSPIRNIFASQPATATRNGAQHIPKQWRSIGSSPSKRRIPQANRLPPCSAPDWESHADKHSFGGTGIGIISLRCGACREEDIMKTTIIALSAAVAMATAPAVLAQGVSSNAPGQEMQQTGSKKGEPGASSYAPGHKMRHATHHTKTSKKTHAGASSYAPGQTTGASTRPATGSSTKSGY